MASSKNIISIAMLLSLLLSITLVAQADDNFKLIDNLCGATNSPDACKACIQRTSGPVTTDLNVLEALLNCAASDAQRLDIDTNDIIDNSATDEATRTALNVCQPLFQGLIKYDGLVVSLVVERNFDASKNYIDNFIFKNLNDCKSTLGSSGITTPTKVVDGMSKVQGDFQAIYQILNVVKA